jgi:hypothetical protein
LMMRNTVKLTRKLPPSMWGTTAVASPSKSVGDRVL